MRLKIGLIAVAFIIAASCSDDTEQHSLQGTWNLTNTSTSEGLNIDYPQGQVQWDFNEANHKLTVKNEIASAGPENIFAGLASGTYTYRVKTEQNIGYLYVEGNEQGAVSVTGSNLVVNNGSPSSRGIIKVFRR